MKRVLLFFLISTSLGAQQELGTYFLQGLHQSSELNPSFDADSKLVISFPAASASLHQRGLSVQSIVKGRLLNDIGGSGDQIMLGSNLSMLKVSYKHNNMRYNFAHNYRSFTDFQSGIPLFTLITEGNASTIGGSIEFSPSFQSLAYSETVFGAALVGDFSVGVSLKLLNGLQNISSERSAFELSVNDDIYQLELKSNFLLNSSFPIDLNNLRGEDLLNIDLLPRNFGLAIDLGASYRTELFSLSASVLDIGYLNWSEQPHNYDADGSFVYAGITIKDILDADFNLVDTLGGALFFTDEQNNYRNFAPAKFYANVNYNVSKNVQLGALLYGHHNYDRTNAAVALNVQRKWGDRHAIAAQYAVLGVNPFNLGISGYTTLGPVQLYGVFDNVVGMFSVLSAENVNFRLGINLAFGREKKISRTEYALMD